jgi:hypothetical protein
MAQNGNTGHWASLTDEQLLHVKFTTDDPENLEGLVLDVPASAQDEPIVEYRYDFRGAKRGLIRCAHCKYPNHLAGIVIKTKEGKRFLVGHDCGEKLYGVKFDALQKDYSDAQNRARALRRLRNLRETLPAFCAWLSTLRRDPALRMFSEIRQDLSNKMPRFWGELQVSAQRLGNVLYAEERVRDFEAERRAQGRYERELEQWNNETVTERKRMRRDGYGPPNEPKFPIYATVAKSVGVVPTPMLFRTGGSPGQYISDIAEQFDNLNRPPIEMSAAAKARIFAYKGKRDGDGRAFRLIASIGAGSTSEIERLLKDVTTLLDQIEVQLERLRELTNLYQPGTLALLAQWANERKLAGTYTAGVGSMHFRDNDGHEEMVILPSGYVPPSAAPLETMRGTLNRY